MAAANKGKGFIFMAKWIRNGKTFIGIWIYFYGPLGGIKDESQTQSTT